MRSTKKMYLFCVPPTCGGAERVTLTIAKLLWQKGNNVKIVIIGNREGEIRDFIPSFFDVSFIKISNIWDFTTFKLVRLLKKQKPSVTFCSLIYLNLRVIAASKYVGGIKSIVRNNNSIESAGFKNRLLMKLLYPLADEILLQTDEMKAEFISSKIRLAPTKIHVIFNPIDKDTIGEKASSINPFKLHTINYVYVGRIERVKGLDVLMFAFSKVLKRVPNAFLYIVGRIDSNHRYYQEIRQQVSLLGLEGNVIWVGFSDNPYQYMRFADCVVLPSRREGLPNVILESMYLQTPVVVTRSVPVINQIVSREQGIVVDVDNVDQLALAMVDILKYKNTTEFKPRTDEVLLDLFKV